MNVKLAIGAMVLGVSTATGVRPPQVATPPSPVTVPTVAIWYWGVPLGTPQIDDFAELRALGFSAVVWPSALVKFESDARRAAATVGTTLITRPPATSLNAITALAPGPRVDVHVDDLAAEDLPALIWRAISHGAREIGFDAGTTSRPGWRTESGGVPAWLAHAKLVARQFNFNAELLRDLGKTVPVPLASGTPREVEVTLIDTPRSWVLIATNVSRRRARGVATLPPGVPPALWSNLFDGEGMAMLDQPAGARWTFDLARGEARVYAIDKKGTGVRS